MGNDWVRRFFIDESGLFLKLMNFKWSTAEEEVKLVVKLLKRHDIKEGSKVLEVGCGNGRIAINLARLGYDVVGIDLSPKYVEDARRRAREYGVNAEFLVGDARVLSRLLRSKYFNAIIFYWTSVIGYYDELTDAEILKQCRDLVLSNGKLFILQHANRDYYVHLFSTKELLEYVIDMGNYVLIERSKFDILTSKYLSTWSLLKKEGNSLVKVTELSTSQRLYSIHELIKLAKEAGWVLEGYYGSLRGLEPFRRPTEVKSYNLVFRTYYLPRSNH